MILCIGQHSNKTGFQPITLLDTMKAKKLKTHETQSASCGMFSPDNKRIALLIYNKTHLWDVASWHEIASFDGSVVAFTPDGKRIVCLQNRDESSQVPPKNLRTITVPQASGAWPPDPPRTSLTPVRSNPPRPR
jgi:WD40 repeat protein